MGNDLRPCNESSSDKHTEMVSTLSNPPLIKQDHASAAPRTLPNHPTAHPLHSGQMHEE